MLKLQVGPGLGIFDIHFFCDNDLCLPDGSFSRQMYLCAGSGCLVFLLMYR